MRAATPRAQIERLRVAFDTWDTDGDGCITRDEVGEAMRSLRDQGQLAAELDVDLDELMRELDDDGARSRDCSRHCS